MSDFQHFSICPGSFSFSGCPPGRQAGRTALLGKIHLPSDLRFQHFSFCLFEFQLVSISASALPISAFWLSPRQAGETHCPTGEHPESAKTDVRSLMTVLRRTAHFLLAVSRIGSHDRTYNEKKSTLRCRQSEGRRLRPVISRSRSE